jgi:hypothetical protein
MTTLLNVTLTTAVNPALTTPVFQFKSQTGEAPNRLTCQCTFTYGSGGTTADVYLQTSFDSGVTWCDVMNFHALTTSLTSVFNLSALTPVAIFAPQDGAISANTLKDGVVGDRLRVKYKSSGTYAASTSLRVDVVSNRLTPA